MANSLSDVWSSFSQSVEQSLSTALTKGTQSAIDAGLAALNNASSNSTGATNPNDWWEKIKAAVTAGAKTSNLGQAAGFSAFLSSPWFFVISAIIIALIIRGFRRK